MRAGDLETSLGVAGTLAGVVALEDYGAVEQVFAEWEVQLVCWVRCEADWLHGWEVVDGGEDVFGWKGLVS